MSVSQTYAEIRSEADKLRWNAKMLEVDLCSHVWTSEDDNQMFESMLENYLDALRSYMKADYKAKKAYVREKINDVN